MMALLLAAQLTVIVQMEQHQTIEAQGDAIVTNEWRDYVFSAPREIGQMQGALLNQPVSESSAIISNNIAFRAKRMLFWSGITNVDVEVVMP